MGSEVIADFSAPATIDEQIVRADYPSSLNEHALQAWAYIRKETVQAVKDFSQRCRPDAYTPG